LHSSDQIDAPGFEGELPRGIFVKMDRGQHDNQEHDGPRHHPQSLGYVAP
jgi:hypothetical protein